MAQLFAGQYRWARLSDVLSAIDHHACPEEEVASPASALQLCWTNGAYQLPVSVCHQFCPVLWSRIWVIWEYRTRYGHGNGTRHFFPASSRQQVVASEISFRAGRVAVEESDIWRKTAISQRHPKNASVIFGKTVVPFPDFRRA